jgi:hypothetical protein
MELRFTFHFSQCNCWPFYIEVCSIKKTTWNKGDTFCFIDGENKKPNEPQEMGRPSLLSKRYRGSILGGKVRPGRDANHSPPSSGEVNNENQNCLSPFAPVRQ